MSNRNELSQEQFERIESYLMGHMTQEEKRAFESEMAADELLLKEVDEHQTVIRSVEAGEMKNRLNKIHTKIETTVTPMHSRKTYWIGIAAGIAALLTSVYLWFYDHPSEKLFDQYSMIDPGLPTPMSATDNYVFYDAMVDYKNEKYQKAIDKWSPLLIESPKNDTLNYYTGAAYFAMEEYGTAVPYFEKVRNFSNSHFADKSEFYLALSWLKTNDHEKIYQLAGDADGEYADRIKDISSELRD